MANVATKIDQDAVAAIVDGLNQGLAETVVTTMKAQNFHWNVTGMAFHPLHVLFQEVYEDHFAAQDEVAERIKALGGHAEGRLSVHLDRSAVKDAAAGVPDAKDMVAAMMHDQEQLSATNRALADLADSHNDIVTNDMAIARMQVHDKFAWMFRAHLGG